MVNDATKYGRILTSEKLIPEGEPVFLLRAQDMFAADIVRHYASRLAFEGYDEDTVSEIRAFADEMDRWPVKKRPD